MLVSTWQLDAYLFHCNWTGVSTFACLEDFLVLACPVITCYPSYQPLMVCIDSWTVSWPVLTRFWPLVCIQESVFPKAVLQLLPTSLSEFMLLILLHHYVTDCDAVNVMTVHLYIERSQVNKFCLSPCSGHDVVLLGLLVDRTPCRAVLQRTLPGQLSLFFYPKKKKKTHMVLSILPPIQLIAI